MIKIIKINNDSANQRIDKYLKRNFSTLTQSFIEKNLRKKNILVNNKAIKSSYLVKIKDQIKIKNYSKDIYSNFEKVKKTNVSEVLKKIFDKSILFENKNFLVIDKWFGISTQGGTNIAVSIDTIIKNISLKYNLVHRLDKETSGLLIIAKNLKYTKIFGDIFRSKKINKTYLAICNGKPKINESLVELMINSKDNKKIITKTYYKVISNTQKFSVIKFEPKTGKKHQLRLVAKNLGCPIIGDTKYNLNKTKYNEKLKLNAFKLQFEIEGKDFNFSSKLPKNFINFIKINNIKFNFKTI